MRHIVKHIVKALSSEEKMLLGRWKIAKTETSIATIIRHANEDHCGTCIKPVKEGIK